MVGGTGAYLADGSEYTGSYRLSVSKENLRDFHHKRLETLVRHPSVDVLLCETFPCIMEVEVILDMMPEISRSLPIVVSFSCANGTNLCSGEKIIDALAVVDKYPQVKYQLLSCDITHLGSCRWG